MTRRVLLSFLSVASMLLAVASVKAVAAEDRFDAMLEQVVGTNMGNSSAQTSTLSETQKLLLGKVVEALRSGTEDRDLAQFLKANFSENKLTREAAQNLMFGRKNSFLADQLENWMKSGETE